MRAALIGLLSASDLSNDANAELEAELAHNASAHAPSTHLTGVAMELAPKRPLKVLAIAVAIVAALYFVVWPALRQLMFILAALSGFT
ncbi:hypothetical protein ACFWXH_06445 [Mesorhizobium sp. NPDC059054]|uniref:hypothetical protein n=1 Tax=Mesorhizobium sp. NPDC059054 TaxID=3346711 RepID=UPI0036BD8AB1